MSTGKKSGRKQEPQPDALYTDTAALVEYAKLLFSIPGAVEVVGVLAPRLAELNIVGAEAQKLDLDTNGSWFLVRVSADALPTIPDTDAGIIKFMRMPTKPQESSGQSGESSGQQEPQAVQP